MTSPRDDLATDMAAEFADLDLTQEAIYRSATGAAGVSTQAALVVRDGQSTGEWAGGLSCYGEISVLKSAAPNPQPHDTVEFPAAGQVWQVTGIIGDGGALWILGAVRDLRPGV